MSEAEHYRALRRFHNRRDAVRGCGSLVLAAILMWTVWILYGLPPWW